MTGNGLQSTPSYSIDGANSSSEAATARLPRGRHGCSDARRRTEIHTDRQAQRPLSGVSRPFATARHAEKITLEAEGVKNTNKPLSRKAFLRVSQFLPTVWKPAVKIASRDSFGALENVADSDSHRYDAVTERKRRTAQTKGAQMTPQPVRDVSETALMVAMWRAAENTRPNPLYRDPLALKLAGDRGREIIKGLPKADVSCWRMAIRTRVIDDLIRDAVAGGVDLVLNLGAGLDTRPYRMELPANLHWVEVDRAEIIEMKESRLIGEKPVCKLERVACDLADAAARQTLLASVQAKSETALVLTEGVMSYLSEDEVGALASDLSNHPCFRYWITGYSSPAITKYRQANSKQWRMENAQFKFAPNDYFGFFQSRGWQAKDVHYMADAAKQFRRPPPVLVRIVSTLSGLLLSPDERAQREKSMAYVLFERF